MYTIINHLFDKANSMTMNMIFLQLNLFWIFLKRFIANPIEMLAESSARETSSFLATANEKLMFDFLLEIIEIGTLTKERERYLIIKTILQEYSDVIFGNHSWLSEQTLGTKFYNHLVNPKKTKAKRRRRFKQYTVWLF